MLGQFLVWFALQPLKTRRQAIQERFKAHVDHPAIKAVVAACPERTRKAIAVAIQTARDDDWSVTQ